MNQNIKNAVDQLWANSGLPTRSVKEQIDQMWEDYDLLTTPVVEEAAKPVASKVLGRVPTRFCAVETCKREFVPRQAKHDMCRECASRHFRALRETERLAAEAAEKIAATRPLTDDQLREQLIEQYKKGELKEGKDKDFVRNGAQVLLFTAGGDGKRRSFTYFDTATAQYMKELQASLKRPATKEKSPEQLRKERIEAAKLEAKNLRASAEAAAEKAKELSDGAALTKLRAETENSEETLEAYCAAEDAASKAWSEADSLAEKASAAEQKLADLIAPPSESKKDKGEKKNGGGKNGQKGRDRHAN